MFQMFRTDLKHHSGRYINGLTDAVSVFRKKRPNTYPLNKAYLNFYNSFIKLTETLKHGQSTLCFTSKIDVSEGSETD